MTRITTKELNERINGLETKTEERFNALESKMDSILALLEKQAAAAAATPEPKAQKAQKATKTEKKAAQEKSAAFIGHLADLHNRTDEEKAAAKATWHEFYDAKWAEWRNEADQLGLKGQKRKEANKAKDAELRALWKSMQK